MDKLGTKSYDLDDGLKVITNVRLIDERKTLTIGSNIRLINKTDISIVITIYDDDDSE